MEIPEDRIVNNKQGQQPKSTRETALEECIGNYEEAIRLSQTKVESLEKELKTSKRQFDKLVNIIEHNVKRSKALLNQL